MQPLDDELAKLEKHLSRLNLVERARQSGAGDEVIDECANLQIAASDARKAIITHILCGAGEQI